MDNLKHLRSTRKFIGTNDKCCEQYNILNHEQSSIPSISSWIQPEDTIYQFPFNIVLIVSPYNPDMDLPLGKNPRWKIRIFDSKHPEKKFTYLEGPYSTEDTISLIQSIHHGAIRASEHMCLTYTGLGSLFDTSYLQSAA